MGRTTRTKEYGIIIEKLTQARLDAGLTQVEVAKKLKRPQSYVSKCEAGEQRVGVHIPTEPVRNQHVARGFSSKLVRTASRRLRQVIQKSFLI